MCNPAKQTNNDQENTTSLAEAITSQKYHFFQAPVNTKTFFRRVSTLRLSLSYLDRVSCNKKRAEAVENML